MIQDIGLHKFMIKSLNKNHIDMFVSLTIDLRPFALMTPDVNICLINPIGKQNKKVPYTSS